jgi:hypothetical protein
MNNEWVYYRSTLTGAVIREGLKTTEFLDVDGIWDTLFTRVDVRDRLAHKETYVKMTDSEVYLLLL